MFQLRTLKIILIICPIICIHYTLFRKLHYIGNTKLNYKFPNATYPWEVYTGSLANLGINSFRLSRALIVEDAHFDQELFDISLGMQYFINETYLL